MPDAYRNVTQSVAVIQRLCGDRITAADAQAYYNVSYRQIVDNYQWYARLKEGVVNTVDEYSTGTVAVTLGSALVVGTGTTWTAAMVGRFIRVGGEFDFYKITAFTSATQITIEKAWPYANRSGESYVIFQYIYSLPDDCSWPLVMTSRGPIEERTAYWVDVRDPRRELTLDFPVAWAPRGEGTNAGVAARRNFTESKVFLLLATHNKVADAALGELYNIAYREVVLNSKWYSRYAETIINTVNPYTTGTVTVTRDSDLIVGVGTVWTAAMIGRYVRVNQSYYFHKITSVLSATSLRIEVTWPAATAAARAYEIFQYIYALPSDAEMPAMP
jgi:hypothetical protein